MLDERKVEAALLKAQGVEITKIAETVGISRTTFYNWEKSDEFKAEVDRFKQEFLTRGSNRIAYLAPKALAKLEWLMDNAESDKVQLDAISKILDKCYSNATRIELNETSDTNANVTIDILEEEFKEFDGE